MAQAKIPTNGGLFIALIKLMIQGVVDLGTSVPVTMVTAALMQAQLVLFTSKNNQFNTARSARQTASDAYQACQADILVWLQAARNALVPKLGNRWNTLWAQGGFINASTAIPTRIKDRVALLSALADFFTAQPSFEAPGLDVTAAKAKSLGDAAAEAQKELTKKEMALKTAGDEWTAAYDPLYDSAQTLIKNLQGKLGDMDPRWLGFGLNMPGVVQTPGQPQNVSAHIDETGAVIVQWDPLALATRYRVRGLLVGVETDYRLVARSTEAMASITDVQPGQTIQIIVQGVNDNLQGVASEPIQFTIPLPGKAERVLTAPMETAANGHSSNGHANGSRLPALA